MKAQDQQAVQQDHDGKEKNRGLSRDRYSVIERAVEKARSEDSCPLSGERPPTTARNLRNKRRSKSVPSNILPS